MSSGRRLTLPAGLRLLPEYTGAAVRWTALSVLAVCAMVIASDLAFRAVLPVEYLAHYMAPLWPRMAWAALGSLREELLYRLGLMTVLAALPQLVGRRVGKGWMVAAIVIAQLANIGTLALAYPPYGLLRFGIAGCVWGWLYWRHGFVSALAGHGL